MPPVLDVAFGELVRRGAEEVLPGELAPRGHVSAMTSWSWSRNPYAPPAW